MLRADKLVNLQEGQEDLVVKSLVVVFQVTRDLCEYDFVKFVFRLNKDGLYKSDKVWQFCNRSGTPGSVLVWPVYLTVKLISLNLLLNLI